ncbi:hypothetical protein V8P29_002471 [Vibrio fluvialis]
MGLEVYFAIGKIMSSLKNLEVLGTRYFPQLHIIKLHAKILANQFSISLCQAQEMLAFYYECGSWSELKYCVNHSITYRRNRMSTGCCHHEAQRLRQVMDDHLKSGTLDVSSLSKLNLQPNTIAYALFNRELYKLFDDEISHLYYHIYEDHPVPQYTPMMAAMSFDNSASNLFLWDIGSRSWMHDYRYGIKMYCNDVHIQGKRVFVIRELDSYFFPPYQRGGSSLDELSNNIDKSFGFMQRKDWYPKYILSYLSKVAVDLARHSDFDTIAVHRVHNIDLFRKKNGVTSVEGMNTIAKALIDAGAIPLEFFGHPDGRMGLSIDLQTSRLLLQLGS